MSSHQLYDHSPVHKLGWSKKSWYALPIVPLMVAFVAMLLIGGEALWLSQQHPHIHLTPDSNEASFLLSGFHAAEQDQRGIYRWTTGKSEIRLPHFGHPKRVIFHLKLGPSPPANPETENTLPTFLLRWQNSTVAHDNPSRVTLDSQGRPRVYHMLVPPTAIAAQSLTVGLESATTVIEPDTRAIGLRFEAAMLSFPNAPIVFPAWLTIIAQVLLLITWALISYRLALSTPIIGLLLLALASLLFWVYVTQPLLISTYLVRFLIASGILALLTYTLLPLAETYARWIAEPALMRLLWGIMLLACMLRLSGSLYPTFYAYDLSLNVERLLKTVFGNLIVTNNSIEFRNGVTVYPPAPYILLLPGLLLHLPQNLLVQGGLAMIDGIGALTIGAMARVIGVGKRATIFTALLYAAIPINLTALWWGLTAQIIGQAFMPPLMIALLVAIACDSQTQSVNTRLRRLCRGVACYAPRAWTAVLMFLTISLLSHIGVAIVAIAWLGIAWIIFWFSKAIATRIWWRFTIQVIISGLIGLALIYANVAVLMVEQFLAVGEKVATSDYVPAYSLIYRGFQISFHEMGFWLLVPSIWLLWRQKQPVGSKELVGSWLAVVAIFWVVEMLTALQVRYIYFLTPLACVAIGLLLDRLALRGRLANVAAWVVVMLLFFQGFAYWYTSTYYGTMMSVTPLLR